MMSPAVRTALDNLIGKECWSIIGGAGTGSVVTLGFGARVEGVHLSRNPNLSLAERQYEAEFAIHVECAWRIETPLEVLFTWTQVADAGCWDEVVDVLRGRQIERVGLSDPAADLALHLSDEVTFNVFCDQDAEGDNYSILSRNGIVVVGPMSNVRTERRVR